MEKEKNLNISLLEQFPILKNASVLQAIKCKGDNYGNFVCLNNQCEHYPFVCQDKKCICRKQHEKCLKNFVQEFFQRMTANVTNLQELIQKNNQKVDNFIAKIINQAISLKQSYKKFIQSLNISISFTPLQKQILTKLQKNELLNLKGKNMAKAYTDSEQNQKQRDLEIVKNMDNLQIVWKTFEEKIMNQFNLLKDKWLVKQIQVNNFKIDSLSLKDSKIVINNKEQQILRNFFDKKIQKFQLLYRASQNNFKLSNFYTNVHQIQNTLILIETQYGKKIGGYTPLIWKPYLVDDKKFQAIGDITLSTFTFSLSNNQKLKPKSPISGIVNYKNTMIFGQTTGMGHIGICDESNQKRNSYVQLNRGFQHESYTKDSLQDWNKLAGNQMNSRYFLIKEWQVWKVSF